MGGDRALEHRGREQAMASERLDPAGETAQAPLRCGRWTLKPFEGARPVLLRPAGPLTLAEFLACPDPAVAREFRALRPEEQQALVLARLSGAPPDRPISLFGQGGYTFGDARREVAAGSPLGVRLIEAECKLVAWLLIEALGQQPGPGQAPPGLEIEPDG
jgi:hypothetical protein